MEGHNIPLHPPVMVSPTPLAQNFHTQPIGISSQELQSLLAKPAKELPVQVSTEPSSQACQWIYTKALVNSINNIYIRWSFFLLFTCCFYSQRGYTVDRPGQGCYSIKLIVSCSVRFFKLFNYNTMGS